LQKIDAGRDLDRPFGRGVDVLGQKRPLLAEDQRDGRKGENQTGKKASHRF
jgi:hypothetical protein